MSHTVSRPRALGTGMFWAMMIRRVYPTHSSNRLRTRHFRLGTPNRASNILLLPKEVHSRSRRQDRVLSRTILPLCRTTILTRRTSITDLRIILVTECLNPLSNTRLCSSLVPQALDLRLRLQRNKVRRPSRHHRTHTVRICMANSILQLDMMSLATNTTRNNTSISTAIRRMRLIYPRASMENTSSSCMEVHRVCKVSWALGRTLDRPQGLR
jgi:hypothetical protein